MKNLLNQADRQEIITRINKLTPESKQLWGTMDVGQMLAHCQKPIEAALQHPKPARSLMGRILGPFIKDSVYGPKPFKKNSYTPPHFKIVDPQDFQMNKAELLDLIERFPREMPNIDQAHPMFGAVTLDEWGRGNYKHLDHHLQQFGV